jgi:hypothetical protein
MDVLYKILRASILLHSSTSVLECISVIYVNLAVPALLYGSECWTLAKQQLQQIKSSEMRFLRSVSGYRRTDKKRNKDIRQNIKLFNLEEK